jgi:hypothetical protein
MQLFLVRLCVTFRNIAELQAEVIGLAHDLLPADHPNIAGSMHNLASMLPPPIYLPLAMVSEVRHHRFDVLLISV